MLRPGKQAPKPAAVPGTGHLLASDRLPMNASSERLTEDQLLAVLQEVKDPEVPVVSVLELGIIRKLEWREEQLRVEVTPTYSGCPATELIEQMIQQALEQAGVRQVEVVSVLTPAWTTDWITEEGREKLRAYGIAPPQGSASKMSLLGHSEEIVCPQCGSHNTRQISEFGSTACKALYQCQDCQEPFDYFKCI
ncbi:ring-1,2-phenylacetyl-CoA epoxidase subunit PaaD [Marinospirillum celere]|uniref:Ring-1,2-phenylacetyl-CoA epoxidase subunit PaaD n=1 Tax=Marinospirillum celere TaxID=1122252 RepID=A0A1I1I057_9GAMM|nr:1,2-phenylacetyl-CoA epoxidase subunit PaaD [Marinospirillum celere]SFC29707.1 ring-1,2-phenylacetyl-CoA epoxidase subunit PaaD [Marinospirillum celere]